MDKTLPQIISTTGGGLRSEFARDRMEDVKNP
jgi:hypothetical protein